MKQPLLQWWSTNSVPRAFFPRVAIGCRLSLKIDRNLSPSLAGGELIRGHVNRRYGIWINIYRSVLETYVSGYCFHFRSSFLMCECYERRKRPKRGTAPSDVCSIDTLVRQTLQCKWIIGTDGAVGTSRLEHNRSPDPFIVVGGGVGIIMEGQGEGNPGKRGRISVP